MSEEVALVELIDEGPPPEVCNLLFTPDGKVARKCQVVRLQGNLVQLAVRERLAPENALSMK
jgi:hypothetical protein